MASTVLPRDVPAQSRRECPSIVALPRVLDGPGEYDAASRPALEFPGCGYEIVGESRAFPGWTADDIHFAMNETGVSAHTSGVLERVGTAMGAAQGTGPDDDPLLRSRRRKAYNIGRAQGDGDGHSGGRAALACGILQSRGIAVSAGFADALQRVSGFAESSDAAIAAAALAAESETDFLRRILAGGR